MKYVLNIVPDVEETLISKVNDYFINEIRFKKLYPHFGTIRVSGVHPFAFLIDKEINNTTVPVGLFPCITLINDTDSKTPEIQVMTPLKNVVITSTEITDIIDNRSKYSVSDEDLEQLKNLTNDSAELNAEGAETYRTANIVVEIWSENPKVKNKIYDLMTGFLLGKNRFTIKDEYSIVINEGSISGEKSGNYNFDFGKIIYGAIMRFTADFMIQNYTIDTDLGNLATINHSAEQIHEGGV